MRQRATARQPTDPHRRNKNKQKNNEGRQAWIAQMDTRNGGCGAGQELEQGGREKPADLRAEPGHAGVGMGIMGSGRGTGDLGLFGAGRCWPGAGAAAGLLGAGPGGRGCGTRLARHHSAISAH
eukprot:3363877-Rhodomonas_salina.1